MVKNTHKKRISPRNRKIAVTPKMTSAPHQAKSLSGKTRVTQYLVEVRTQPEQTGLLRVRPKAPKSSNLFPGDEDRRSSRWLWIIWILPIGAVVAYFAAHSGVWMVGREWVEAESGTHKTFCTALDIGITFGAKFEDEYKRAGCPSDTSPLGQSIDTPTQDEQP